MILFFYNLALLTVFLAGLPWWLWRIATTDKYREGMGERLGRPPKRLRQGEASGDRNPVIWLHAVSVGEVLAVSRLVEEIGAAFPGHRLLISTTTRTGRRWRGSDSERIAFSIVRWTCHGQCGRI